MKNFRKIGIGLLIVLAGILVSFSFSSLDFVPFSFFKNLEPHATAIAGSIGILALLLTRVLNQKQLIGLGMFLTFFSFTSYGNDSGMTMIFWEHHREVAMVLLASGLGVLANSFFTKKALA